MPKNDKKRKGPSKTSVARTYAIPTLYRRKTYVDFLGVCLGICRGAIQQFIQLPPDPTMRNKVATRMDIKRHLVTILAGVPRCPLERKEVDNVPFAFVFTHTTAKLISP